MLHCVDHSGSKNSLGAGIFLCRVQFFFVRQFSVRTLFMGVMTVLYISIRDIWGSLPVGELPRFLSQPFPPTIH